MPDGPDPGHMARFCEEIVPGMLAQACAVKASDAGLAAEDICPRLRQLRGWIAPVVRSSRPRSSKTACATVRRFLYPRCIPSSGMA
jgi:hypothetical protein